MGKKKSSIGFIYLIGMLLVAIGFCLPMFCARNPINGKFLTDISSNGFDYINFKSDNSFLLSIAALIIFAAAVLGVVVSFLKIKSLDIIKLVLAIICIVGGVIIAIKFNDNWLTKKIGSGFLKHAYIGFYMVCAGWIVSLVGAIIKK